MNNKVTNEETQVEKTIDLNDRDYLYTMLQYEKTLSNNLSTVINEASNTVLYDKYYYMFNDIKSSARDAFNLMFKNGWYPLERETEEKKNTERTTLQEKFNELEK